MPKKIITIVTSSRTAPGASALKIAFTNNGWRVRVVLTSEVEQCVRDIEAAGEVIFRIGPRSFAIYRDKILPKIHHERHAVLLMRMLEGFSKATQAKVLSANNVAIPRTHVITNISEVVNWLPSVLKYPIGNQGVGVFLTNTAAQLETLTHEIITSEGVCVQQEYIPLDTVSDKRLFVVGDQVIASMRRLASGSDFRSNLHQGGSGEVYHPTAHEESLALKSAASLELPFCGVDIIDSERGPLVLEVNPSPGFAIAKITGIPIADKIVEYYNQGGRA